MTPTETLARLAEAREKATPEPWHIIPMTGGGSVWCANDGPKGVIMEANDAAFVVLAGSTDFRAILSQVEAMQRVADGLTEKHRLLPDALDPSKPMPNQVPWPDWVLRLRERIAAMQAVCEAAKAYIETPDFEMIRKLDNTLAKLKEAGQ